MKRIIFHTALSLLVLTGAVSCSDDVNDGPITPDGDTQTEIMTDCAGAAKKIGFETSGKWSATVNYGSSDDTDWISLLDESGKGNSTLSYLVDANTTDDMRVAEIVISSGDHKLVYTVKQQPENFDYNDAVTDMSMFNSDVPLGYGMKVERGFDNKLVKRPVFRVEAYNDKYLVNEYAQAYKLALERYVSSSLSSETKTDLLYQDAAEEQSRDINANLKVNVAYGIFKMNLNGDFKMFGSNTMDTYTYGVIARHPIGSYTLDYEQVYDDYQKLVEASGNDANAKAASKILLSSQFTSLMNDIEEAVAKGNTYAAGQDNDLTDALNDLDRYYGPAFISMIDVGGTAELNYTFNKEEAKDTLKIHGDLDIGVNALLSVDVKAEANYNNFMKSHIQSSTLSARIKGGTATSRQNLLVDFGKLISKDSAKEPLGFEDMIKTIGDWYSTIKLDEKGTYTCIDYYPTPIWIFFSRKAQRQIKAYFKDRYPNKTDEKQTCPYIFDVQKMIEYN